MMGLKNYLMRFLAGFRELLFVLTKNAEQDTSMQLVMNAPIGLTPNLTLKGTVEKVHDGDTLTVTVPLKMNVRLIQCYAPELKTPAGPQSKLALEKIALSKEATITIPLTGKTLGDATTMGRILGRVNIDGVDVSDLMVKQGYAKSQNN